MCVAQLIDSFVHLLHCHHCCRRFQCQCHCRHHCWCCRCPWPLRLHASSRAGGGVGWFCETDLHLPRGALHTEAGGTGTARGTYPGTALFLLAQCILAGSALEWQRVPAAARHVPGCQVIEELGLDIVALVLVSHAPKEEQLVLRPNAQTSTISTCWSTVHHWACSQGAPTLYCSMENPVRGEGVLPTHRIRSHLRAPWHAAQGVQRCQWVASAGPQKKQ